MDRQIVCFHVPAFSIALARLADPQLRDRPVAMAPFAGPRSLIHEASREAQQDGVSAGLSVEAARRRCPALRLLPPDPDRIRTANQSLWQTAARFAPIWEPIQPGHLFLDLTGTTRLYGRAADAAARIEREITQQIGVTGVVGVGSNKLVAEVAASLIHPPQLCDVRLGAERAFLAPLPVSTLPGLHGNLAREILPRLDDVNLLTLQDIADTPLAALESVLGSHAARVHRWAHGIDRSPVLPVVERPRLDCARTLSCETIDDAVLLGTLSGMLEHLCRRLRTQRRVCGRLTLILRYRDQVETSTSVALRPSTHWEVDLAPALRDLLARGVQRRVRVRALRLGAEALEPAQEQLALFPDDSPAAIHQTRGRRLALAVDRVRDKFGDRAIWFGRTREAHEAP